MKTLRQLRIERLISQCDQQMEKLLEEVSLVRECAINGQLNPKVAIKKYDRIIKRAIILNRRTWTLSNKEVDFGRSYTIDHFNEYAEFFEL